MKYRTFEKENEIYFQYNPTKQQIKRVFKKIDSKDSPFKVLKDINFN